MKGYLLDTHIVLWLAAEPDRLSEQTKQALLDAYTVKYVSIASAWEVALKIKVGKLELSGGLGTFFAICERNGLPLLGVERPYIEKTLELPFIHKDPFDRLIIATAQHERLTLISADKAIQQYSLEWLC